MQKAYKLLGKHRHYDWGGSQFIPQLMGLDNTNQKPFAEYWLGAHPAAVSEIITHQGHVLLDEKINAPFEALPYLLKILDVEKMLSIQVHPNQQNAKQGYEKEEMAGIDRDAPTRNYKDKNHKPEVMVALSDFWLLHGFLSPALMKARLNEFYYFNALLEKFQDGDYELLYRYFMELPQEEADLILFPLMKDAIDSVHKGNVDKSHPHWWANKYYSGVVPTKNIDKGLFSIYILNIVKVLKYEGVFQGAGLLHAYLEGQNIELMANSDNVLRAGLTAKHVDVQELLQNVRFEPTYPNILQGNKLTEMETHYPCLVPDFGITKIDMKEGSSYTLKTVSLEIILVTEGEVMVDTLHVKAGEACLLPTGKEVELSAIWPNTLFRAFVP